MTESTMNTTPATAQPTAPANVQISAHDLAIMFFMPAMWDDFAPLNRDDVQTIVNHWNALGEGERPEELRMGIESRLEKLSKDLHTAESYRLACFDGVELFREVFNAEIPATASRNESPRAESRRVLSAVSAPSFRPRFKEDGTLEVRIVPRPIKCADILKQKAEKLKNSRPDRHAEKTDPATAYAQIFTPAIESAFLTALVYAEKVNNHSATIPAPNSRARSAVESVNATFPENVRNPFALATSRTTVQEQVRAVVSIILDNAESVKAWSKAECNFLYSDLFKMKNHAPTVSNMPEAFDCFAARAHFVKYGKTVVIDGAGIHSAESEKNHDPNIIR